MLRYMLLVALLVLSGCSNDSPTAQPPKEQLPIESKQEQQRSLSQAESDLLLKMSSSKAAELSMLVSRQRVSVRCGDEVLATNEQPRELAGISESIKSLVDAKLMAKSRTIDDTFSGTPTETVVYALTTLGHETADKIKASK